MFFSFLDKSHSIASPGYNRWLVPPAALAIHLCIGQIYAYSVFNKPMSQLIGISQSTDADWQLTSLGWIFSIALFTLGASAALFGKWLERVGPRQAMFASALCFSSGFLISALGVYLHQLWLIYVGHGVVGGIGLGLGYISPVSTLIKWFPDRPGMATGMAIMGFGGGAMIASPLSVFLMNHFQSATSTGVGQTFVVMGLLYFCFMMFGVVVVRVPALGWKPSRWVDDHTHAKNRSTSSYVDADTAIRTLPFYLLFGVLMLNVTAGIGVLGQASVMIQEVFSADSVGERMAVSATAAGGFVGLLSLFNMVGRFVWSSLSDILGRKTTYNIFFLVGAMLYVSIPSLGGAGSIFFFIVSMGLIMSMYGGGFATIPAYLRDVFGTFHVGAIHGRLLLAWSAAAILGPVLVNYIRAYQIDTLQLPPAQVYSITMYIMAGLLFVGLILNNLVKPPSDKHYRMTGGAVVREDKIPTRSGKSDLTQMSSSYPTRKGVSANTRLVLTWLFVGIPLIWGVLMTLRTSFALLT